MKNLKQKSVKYSLSLALFLGALGLSSVCASNARAEAYVGGMFGLGSASGSGVGYDSGLALGATLGFQLVPGLGIAGTFLHDNLKTTLGKIDAGVSQYLVEANFISLFLLSGGVHVGDVNQSIGSTSSTDLGFGAHLGADIKLTSSISVGGAVYWTYVTQSNDKHSLFNVVVPVKYWF